MPTRIAIAALACIAVAIGCAPGASAPRAGGPSTPLAVNLEFVDDCPDEAGCGQQVRFRGRIYNVVDSVESVAEVEAVTTERLPVADSTLEIALTNDPDVIYINTDEGWLRFQAAAGS